MKRQDRLEQLERYVDGEMGTEERRVLEEHLARCPGCTERLTQLRAEEARLRAALGPQVGPERIDAAVMERVRAGVAPRRTRFEDRWWPFLRRWAAGVVGLAVVALAALLWSRSGSETHPGIDLARPVIADGIGPLEVQLLGQQEFLCDSPAAVRVIVLHHDTQTPLEGARVSLSLRSFGAQRRASLLSADTDAQGTLAANFRVPDWPPGDYQLSVQVTSERGSALLARSVTLRRLVQVLLTTDKPVYQPNQTMHLRTLCLRRPDLKPVSNTEITLEVEDGRGNKVFKKVLRLSPFGLAAADFTLADEVNFGDYRVRAILDGEATEKIVAVRKYVLPKFKIEFQPEKEFYQPGETVEGTVRAEYFFGEPVRQGQVDIRASSFDVGFHEFAHLTGKTDEQGVYRFTQKLPDHFVGQPLEQGQALTQWAVTVTDGADHPETLTHTLTVAEDSLRLVVLPESGALVPGVENTLFLVTSYPDGRPAQARLTVKEGSRTTMLDADELGLAEYRTTPGAEGDGRGGQGRGGDRREEEGTEGEGGKEGRSLRLEVMARDGRGNEGRKTFSLDFQEGPEALLLRPDRALYCVGERMRVEVLTTASTGTVYLDAVKDGQTILTQSMALAGGRGRLEVTLPPEAAGTLELHAYRIRPDQGIVRDTRVVYVNPADDLQIALREGDRGASRDFYDPGGTARMEFTVTDSAGAPTRAALGVQVVDESVFAIQEDQPGLAKVYFTLAKELLTPKVEIQGIEPADLVVWGGGGKGWKRRTEGERRGRKRTIGDGGGGRGTEGDQGGEEGFLKRKQKAAQVLFTGAARAADFSLQANSIADQIRLFRERWQSTVVEDAARITEAIDDFRVQTGRWPTVEEGLGPVLEAGLLTPEDLQDPWGRRYLVRGQNGWNLLWVTIHTIGPDGQPATEDDLEASSPAWSERQSRRSKKGKEVLQDRVFRGIAMMGPGMGGGMMAGGMGGMMGGGDMALPPAPSPPPPSRLGPPVPMEGPPPMAMPAPSLHQRLHQPEAAASRNHLDTWVQAAPRRPLGRDSERPRNAIDAAYSDGLVRVRPRPESEAAEEDTVVLASAYLSSAEPQKAPAGARRKPPRLRHFFPETLFFNPAVLTDAQGRATVDIPLADSITTWRLSALASSLQGQLGSVTHGLRVFQDFFIDLDLPVALTQGDEVSVPVAVHNYLDTDQTVRVVLRTEGEGRGAERSRIPGSPQVNPPGGDWFDLLSSAEQTVVVEPNRVKAVYFRLRARTLGSQKLTVYGYGSDKSDAVSRSVEVIPWGREITTTINDRLEGNVRKTITHPPEALPGMGTILVKIYPGLFSQVVEGLDSILRMPYGCFEQTSSVTYPNVLALNYLKQTGRATPEVELKAQEYVSLGYQRLVSFEVRDGGFSWFGSPPANKLLTAYGLMEFGDMAQVHEVDPDLLARIRGWLLAQRNSSGTWDADAGYLHSWSRLTNSAVLPTAYIAWALLETAEQGNKGEGKGENSIRKELQPALRLIRSAVKEVEDPYTLAICANVLVAAEEDGGATDQVLSRLVEQAVESKETAHWKARVATFTFADGPAADLETTALAAQALLRSGRYPRTADKALRYLIRAKDPRGTWGTTQATVLALKALLQSLNAATEEIQAEVRILANGRSAARLTITPGDSDVVRQVNLKDFVQPGANEVQIRWKGSGRALYQMVQRYYVPWGPEPKGEQPLAIAVDYDRTELARNDSVKCRVTVRNRQRGAARMVLVDLGIPPGFRPEINDLEDLVDRGRINKYNVTAQQVIVYLDQIKPSAEKQFAYHLTATMPLRAKTPGSQVYLYYRPEVRATARPVEMTVR